MPGTVEAVVAMMEATLPQQRTVNADDAAALPECQSLGRKVATDGEVRLRQVRAGTTFGDRTDIVPVSGAYRYVRMYGQSRTSPYGYSIWEMELYGLPAADTDGDGVDELYVANDDDHEINRYLWSDGAITKAIRSVIS